MRILSDLRGDRVGFQYLQFTLPKLGMQDGVERIIFKLGAAKSTSTSLAVPRSSAQFHLGVKILLSVESFGQTRILTPSLVVLPQPTTIHRAAILSAAILSAAILSAAILSAAILSAAILSAAVSRYLFKKKND